MSLRSGPTSTVRCPRCGASFGCGAKTWGCWCGDMTLAPEVHEQLAVEYEGCLCEGCLRELERQRSAR